MEKKEKTKKQKEHYEKPQMNKVYSTEHNRCRPFETVTSSGGGCGACAPGGGGCGCSCGGSIV